MSGDRNIVPSFAEVVLALEPRRETVGYRKLEIENT